jgi:magnesium-transporting ATPase (P-type)
VGAITGQQTPLKAVQLLWVNLIMDTMGALALGTEMPTRKLLQRRPYSINAPLISPVMWRNIFGQFFLQSSMLFGLLYGADAVFNGANGQPLELNSKEHYTLIFNAFVFLQVFNEINSRKVNEEMNVFEKFFDNSTFTIVILLTGGFQVHSTYQMCRRSRHVCH